MSSRELYKVIVRMLYDPALVGAVYDEPEQALAGVELTGRERAWLVQPDRRAYLTDRMRRARSLTGLMEEFPVASAFVLRRGREGSCAPETGLLDSFFSHPIFHNCIQAGKSMVFAFAEFLTLPEHAGIQADPRTAPLARLEAAIARLRRARAPEGRFLSATGQLAPEARLRTPDWIEICSLAAGTSELHGRVSKALSAGERAPVQMLADPRWSLPVLLDLDLDANEEVLIERPASPGLSWDDTSVRHATITFELASLLLAARGGISYRECLRTALALGAEPGEEAGIIDSLLAEGLLFIER
jgi:hypothetical protein